MLQDFSFFLFRQVVRCNIFRAQTADDEMTPLAGRATARSGNRAGREATSRRQPPTLGTGYANRQP